jgi:hypothetical protein
VECQITVAPEKPPQSYIATAAAGPSGPGKYTIVSIVFEEMRVTALRVNFNNSRKGVYEGLIIFLMFILKVYLITSLILKILVTQRIKYYLQNI